VQRLIAILLLALPLLAQPGRIVSTAPGFTETLFALGLGDKVVGVSRYCNYPAAAQKLPRVGTYLKPSVERIAALRPDLVLMHEELSAEREQLERLGLRVLTLRNVTLPQILQTIQRIGDATGTATQAKQLLAGIETQFARVRSKLGSRVPRTLLFIVGRNTGTLENLVVTGKGSWLNEVMQVAGGRNAMGDGLVAYPKLSLEGVLRLDPDVIVDMGDMADTRSVPPQKIREVKALWSTQSTLRSVRAQRIFAVAADLFVVPGPRVGECAEAFARMLHPEVGW
jgi:iron complex transport system substrate-binding protein